MHISLEEINDAIIRLSKTINDARWSTQPRILSSDTKGARHRQRHLR